MRTRQKAELTRFNIINVSVYLLYNYRLNCINALYSYLSVDVNVLISDCFVNKIKAYYHDACVYFRTVCLTIVHMECIALRVVYNSYSTQKYISVRLHV